MFVLTAAADPEFPWRRQSRRVGAEGANLLFGKISSKTA